jgi:hypothetical protein
MIFLKNDLADKTSYEAVKFWERLSTGGFCAGLTDGAKFP